MSSRGSGSTTPRAVIHKRILEVAEANPDASLEGIADTVSGASVDLVDRVLAEYGDPCGPDETDDNSAMNDQSTTDPELNGDSTDDKASPEEPSPDAPLVDGLADATGTHGTPAHGAGTEPSQPVDPRTVPDRAAEVLGVLHKNPGFSQADLAERFDVSRSTINRWLHSIPGFDWDERHAVAQRLVESSRPEDTQTSNSDTHQPPTEPDGRDSRDPRLTDLDRRVTRLEADANGADLDPDLLHKVVHACLESDRLDEEEELRVLQHVL
jgi:transcriptional regulator with XRE-family HTH domain